MTPKSNSFHQAIRPVSVRRIREIIAVICLFTTLAFMAGCKKDDGPAGPKGEYYIKFKANGGDRLIDDAVMQGIDIVDSTSLTIGGKKVYTYSLGAANSSLESLIIGFYSETRLTAPRTFNEAVVFKNTYTEAILTYAPDAQSLTSGQVYVSIGTVAPIPGLFPEYASLPRDFTVSISEYNDTYVRGTFSGSVYQENGQGDLDTTKKISITEGEFKLKLP